MNKIQTFFLSNTKWIILLVLLYFPLFGHLDTLPIRLWDESRLTMNAYEMSVDGRFIVTHFDGMPDMWNTKPPLLIWMQVVFVKLLGMNELSLRLPSALAALFTCFGLLYVGIKYLKDYWYGFIAVLVLVTSLGYIDNHAIRTGDYDSLLTFLSFFSAFSFFCYIERKEKKFLYCFFVSLALAVLTKSVAGLLFLPAYFIWALVQKQFVPMLKNKHFYFGLLSFFMLVAGYYILREILNPGYLKAVNENEFGGRYLTVIESHKHDFWFYFINLKNTKFLYWILFLPFGFLIGLLHKNTHISRLNLFSSICVVCYFLVVSSAQTKLYWYDVPLYPFLALIVANSIYLAYQWLRSIEWSSAVLKYNIIPYVMLFFVFFTPYVAILDKVISPAKDLGELQFYGISKYLSQATKGKKNVQHNIIVWDDYRAHIDCYLYVLQKKGVNLSYKTVPQLQQGDTILISMNTLKMQLDTTFNYLVLDQMDNTLQCKIVDRKNTKQGNSPVN